MPDDKPEAKPTVVFTGGGGCVPPVKVTIGKIESITITDRGGIGYTADLPAPPDRDPHNSRCPKLGTRWVSADGAAWCKPFGWQGGYVWVEGGWGTQLWAYDEFWAWVEEAKAETDAKPETWRTRPAQL